MSQNFRLFHVSNPFETFDFSAHVSGVSDSGPAEQLYRSVVAPRLLRPTTVKSGRRRALEPVSRFAPLIGVLDYGGGADWVPGCRPGVKTRRAREGRDSRLVS